MLSRYCKEKTNQNLYIVIADVKDAFGSINHQKMDEVLKYVSTKLPKHFYMYKFKYRYKSTAKVMYKKILMKEPIQNRNDTPVVKGADFISKEESKTVDVKKALMIVAKRIRLHTIQLKIGYTRKLYSVKQGILQGKKNFFCQLRCDGMSK